MRIWRTGDLLLPMRATSSCHRCRSRTGWRDRQVLSGCTVNTSKPLREVNSIATPSPVPPHALHRMQRVEVGDPVDAEHHGVAARFALFRYGTWHPLREGAPLLVE